MIKLNKKLLFNSLGVLVILLLAGVILAYPLYQYLSKAALSHLLEESRQYGDEGEEQLAFQKAYRAHQLFPESEEAKLALARSSLNYPHQDTPAFWDEVLDSPNLTAEDLNNYVDYLLDSFQLERAFQLMARLYYERPDNEAVHRIYIQSLIRNRKYNEVVQVTTQLIDRGFENAFNFENLYAALWALNTEESRNAAIKLLYNNAQRDDAIGASAARRMLALEVSTPEGQVKLANNLATHPEASQEDLLFALQYLLKFDAISTEESEEFIQQQFNPDHPDDLFTLAQWYLENDAFSKILDLAPPETFMADSRTSRIYHLALIQSGDAQEAYENTFSANMATGLNPVDVLLIRAQAQIQLGRMAEFEESLKLAVEQASISQFSALEEALFEVNAWTVADKLYERVLEIEGLESIGFQKMIWSKYLQGNEFELLHYLRQVELADYEEEPPVLAFLAYLKLLYGQNSVESKFLVENLVAEFPNVQDFQMIQAFSFYLDGNIRLAWKLLENEIPSILQDGTRYQRLILYLIARKSGYQGNLQNLGQHLSTNTLLPSESRMLHEQSSPAESI